MPNQAATARRDEDVLRETLRARVEDDDLKLPLLPEVAQRVLAMADSPTTGISELARLINRDPSLCAHVLRAANSPWYSRGAAIVSVRQALAQLGAENLAQIAWTIAIGSSLLRSRLFSRELLRWWSHALATGFVAKEIARTLRANVETAFIAGLMARLGQPMVYEAITMIVDELELQPTVAQTEAAALIEEFEGRAGLLLARKWKLPAAVGHAICGTAVAQTPDEQHDAALAALAQRLAANILGQVEGNEVEDLVTDPACVTLNLYADTLADILSRKDDLLTSIEAVR